jgi:hypothetical protein
VRTSHDFGWHFNMSQALAKHPDELLYAMEDKQADFARLLEQRADTFGKWQGALSRWQLQIEACNIHVPPGALFPLAIDPTNPSLIDLYTVSELVLPTDQPVLPTVVDVAPISQPIIFPPIIFQPTSPTAPIFTGGGISPIFAGFGHPIAPFVPKNDCTQLPDLVFTCGASFEGARAQVNDLAVRVAGCLQPIDQQIEQALKEARADGCLEPHAVTPCDWTPNLFVRELHGRTLDGKESAYHECERFTGGDFGPGSLIRTAATLGISSQNNMAQSTEHVDQFFKDLRAWAKQQAFPRDPDTGKPIFGARTADGSQLGNRDFGVSYNYDAGWKLKNLDNKKLRICAAEVALNADFDVSAEIFGHKENLVSSHSYLRTDEVASGKKVSHQVSLIVLGQEILGAAKTGSVTVPPFGGAVAFPALNERIVERRTLLEARARFAIGPIPVTLAAGAAGEIGVELSLQGNMEYGCPNPSQNPNTVVTTGPSPDLLRLGAEGGARPYAALNAFASAAVDLVIASAGVRTDLTLLQLSIPFTASVSANLDAQSSPTARARTQMKLSLQSLSGRISVFIDTVFGKVLDETIFKWSGPRVETTVVDEQWNTDLRAARQALVMP